MMTMVVTIAMVEATKANVEITTFVITILHSPASDNDMNGKADIHKRDNVVLPAWRDSSSCNLSWPDMRP